MSQQPILSIVIPVFNKFNFTKSCLADLSRLPSDHQIIIVDNGSIDETQSSLQGSTEITYIRNDKNLGFAKACNIGYGNSLSNNVLFLNNDIRVRSHNYNEYSWTAPLIQKCSDGLVGPTMGQLDNNLNFVQEANKILPGNSYMSGWCLASSKGVWSKLQIPRNEIEQSIPQIFSEEFGLAYFEDTDLSFRARKLGIAFHVVDIPVIHFGRQSSKQINTAMLYQQAREIFVKKWLGNI